MDSRNIPLYEPTNFYIEDAFFQKLVRHYLPDTEWSWTEPYLKKMGALSASELRPLVLTTDRNRPQHIPYDPAGNRIDTVEYDESYKVLARKTYEFGIIGLGESESFQKENRRYSPVFKFALGYLFSQAGSVLYCPICMTDGTLQLLKRHASPELQAKWIPRITSMNYDEMYDGATYLTEVQGGSDVGANSCRAKLENGQWRLYGEKWFCSNIGSKTAMVLARPEGAPEGTRGLGLFLLPRDLENGARNAIWLNRIKNKLGTCEMATGEVELKGALAYPVGDVEKGFSYMTDMLNLSRIYNSVWSIGLTRRAFLEAKHYAAGRKAFGKTIQDYPLVAQTLKQMETDTELATALVFDTLYFMDRVERSQGNSEDEIMLRLLTPVIKYFTAEKAIEAGHRAIEIFAGNGCIEDFPVAKLLRDAQILAIWEGTANILSLDLLRVLKKSSAAEIFVSRASQRLEQAPKGPEREALQASLQSLKQNFAELLAGKDGHQGQLACREVAWKLALFSQNLAYLGLGHSLSK